MDPRLQEIFQESFRELRPRTQLPVIHAAFYRFANVNNTIRIRQDQVYARISDLLEGAPDDVLRAIAHILLAKLYRRPIEPASSARYRKYVSSHDMATKTHLIRNMRGRKHLNGARGQVYDLHEVFDSLNRRFFHGLMGRPDMTWSRDHARNSLGHYDPAHNTIVVSRIFDRPQVPRFAIEYLVYHEMLHLKHPVRLRGTRRCVHSAAFQAEEKLFPDLEAAKNYHKRL